MFLAVLEIYSLLCLRGNIFSRIFMPLIAFLINTVISFAFSYFVSFFTGYTHYESVSYTHLGVKIEFAEGGPSLQDTLTDYLIRQKSGLRCV